MWCSLQLCLVLLFFDGIISRQVANHVDFEDEFAEIDPRQSIRKRFHLGPNSPRTPFSYYPAKDSSPDYPSKQACHVAGGSAGAGDDAGVASNYCYAPMAYQICEKHLNLSDACPESSAYSKWDDPCHCAVDIHPRNKQYVICCQLRNQSVQEADAIRGNIVHLRNSTDLHVRLKAAPENRLHVVDVTRLEVTLVETGEESNLYFSASRSNGGKVPNSVVVGLHKSNFTIIEGLRDVTELNLFYSHVEKIKGIELIRDTRIRLWASVLREYVGFRLYKALVGQMENVTADCSAQIRHSEIASIRTTKVERILIWNSSIKKIHPRGLTIFKSELDMKQVTISHLHKGGIVASATTSMSLLDVTVDRCDEPCFVVGESISVVNVSINGRRVEDGRGPAFNNTAYPDRVREDIKVLSNSTCSTNESEMECDFSSYRQKLLFVVGEQNSPYEVSVSNHSNLMIMEGCLRGLQIKNVTGFYRTDKKLTCGKKFPVTIQNSSLTDFISLAVGSLSISGNSEIDQLSVGVLNNFKAHHLVLSFIEDLEYRKTVETDSFVYSTGFINEINQLVFDDPAVMMDIMVEKIYTVLIDYDSTDKNYTVFRDWKVGHIRKSGIHIKSGSLFLHDFTIYSPVAQVVKMDEQGKVLLQLSGRNMKNICKRAGRLFDALFRHQVVFLDGIAPDWITDCIQYSHTDDCHPAKRGESSIAIPCIDPRSQCVAEFQNLTVCNVTQPELPLLLGNSPHLNNIQRIIVNGSQSLILGQHCVTEVFLVNCLVEDMLEEANSCYFNLYLIHSEADSVVNKVWNLFIKRSQVNNVEQQNYIQDVTVEDSEVGMLSLHDVEFVHIEHSDVAAMRKINIRSELNVTDSNVKMVASLLVKKGSASLISKSVIGTLYRKAIEVHGTLIFKNVHIQNWSEKSITLGPTARIFLKKVHVKYYSPELLSFLKQPSVFVEKLTVGECGGSPPRGIPTCSELMSVDRVSDLEHECQIFAKKRGERSIDHYYYEKVDKPPYQKLVTLIAILSLIVLTIIGLKGKVSKVKKWFTKKREQEGVETTHEIVLHNPYLIREGQFVRSQTIEEEEEEEAGEELSAGPASLPTYEEPSALLHPSGARISIVEKPFPRAEGIACGYGNPVKDTYAEVDTSEEAIDTSEEAFQEAIDTYGEAFQEPSGEQADHQPNVAAPL